MTIHCPLRSVGRIENGVDGPIAFCEHLHDGPFIEHVHGDGVCQESPYYDVRATAPDIETLTEVAGFRKDGVLLLIG